MGTWRTGTDRGDVPGPRERTVYGPDGELRGVMFATEDAKLVVRALRLMDRAERLEAALRRIASCESIVPGDVVDVARVALAGKPGRECPDCEGNEPGGCSRCEGTGRVAAGYDGATEEWAW